MKGETWEFPKPGIDPAIFVDTMDISCDLFWNSFDSLLEKEWIHQLC